MREKDCEPRLGAARNPCGKVLPLTLNVEGNFALLGINFAAFYIVLAHGVHDAGKSFTYKI